MAVVVHSVVAPSVSQCCVLVVWGVRGLCTGNRFREVHKDPPRAPSEGSLVVGEWSAIGVLSSILVFLLFAGNMVWRFGNLYLSGVVLRSNSGDPL